MSDSHDLHLHTEMSPTAQEQFWSMMAQNRSHEEDSNRMESLPTLGEELGYLDDDQVETLISCLEHLF